MAGPRTLLAALCAVATTGLGLAACGDDDSSSEGPASAVPADAPVYFESVVNLEEAEGLTDALETLGVEDPAGMLAEELDAQAEADGSPVNYSDDIEPLLGERGGFFISSFGSAGDLASGDADCAAIEDALADAGADASGEGCVTLAQDFDESAIGSEGDGALIVETTDEDEARERIA